MLGWSSRDAGNRYSALVDGAVARCPQRMTRRGKPAVVVLVAEEDERLRHLEKMKAQAFADLLPAIPQDEGGEEFERLRLTG